MIDALKFDKPISMEKLNLLKGRLACVTGASSGFGKAASLALAQQGCDLILVARRYDRLKALAEQLRDTYQINAWPIECDLASVKAIQSLVSTHEETFQKVSILINSAGLAAGVDSIQEASLEDWNQMIDVNVRGLFTLTRKLLPFLRKQPHADIVNLGSVAGRWVYPGGGVYCATKHAVRAFSEGLRMDLCGEPIRVSTVEPGMAETEFSEVRLKDKKAAKEVYQGMKPLSAEDVAQTITWVLTQPAHVTIQEVVIYPTSQAAVKQVHRQKAT